VLATGAGAAVALCGCDWTGSGLPADSAKAVIGPQGGTLSLAKGPILTVPPGALAAPVELSIVRSGAAAPQQALSAIYDFKPVDTVFAKAATVQIPVPASTKSAVVYWSSAGAPTRYEIVPCAVEAGFSSAQVTHLGVGYAGAVPGEERTVSGAVSTLFWQDDGTRTKRPGVLGPQMRVPAIFVPGAGGYKRIAVTEGPDSSFLASGVPSGRYFLQIDTVYPPNVGPGEAVFTQLVELTTSNPDLSTVMAARPNVQAPAGTATLALNIANLTPWVDSIAGFSGDMILIAGSQAHVYSRPQISGVRPQAGGTAYTNTFRWNVGSTAWFIGLPDASQGDVEFVYQRSTRTAGSNETQGVVRYASRFARVDNLTLREGTQQTLSVSLADVAQSGNARADLRSAQFAALAPQVNPSAMPSQVQGGSSMSILAVPHTVDYPEAPGFSASSSLLWVQAPLTTDVDYGVVTYGQLPAPLWQEERYSGYTFDLQLPAPSGKTYDWFGGFLEFVRPADAGPVAPVLGPPRSPLIGGRDAFVPQAGVGVQPVISWSPPSLGSASSYVVRIDPLGLDAIPPGSLLQLSFAVYSGTSLKVPAGFLQQGRDYVATITALSAPWDQLDRPPLRSGAPLRMSDCVTAVFTP